MDRSQKTNSIARHIREMGRPIDQGSAVEAARTDLSDENLATAVESNSCEWIRFQGRLPWVEFHDDGDVYWLFAGDAWPRNTVAAAHFTPASASRRIQDLLAPHLAAKVSCNWIVGPRSQPGELGKYLSAAGFKCMIHCAGMACDLDHLPAAPATPTGFALGLSDQVPSLQPITTERRRLRFEGRQALLQSTPCRVWWYSASIRGIPIGETAIFLGAGVAGLYDVEVLETYRRRGIGSALVYAALDHARRLGCRIAVLGATGMGMGVYSRFGFREVCKLSFWKYGKMKQLGGSIRRGPG